MNDCAPPKQKPTVIARSVPSAASAASTSSATVSGLVCWTCGMYSKLSSRGPESGRAAEVVDRDRRVPGRREAFGQLLVEAEEAAHVGQHDDADRALGPGQVGRELGAVGRGQRQLLAGGSAGDDGEAGRKLGDDRVERKAHEPERTLAA